MTLGRHDKGKSRFGAPRLTERVLQATLPNGLQGEIRQGKIVDGELVTNEEDVSSDDSLGPRGRRIIEGLKRGLTVEQVLANEPSEVGAVKESSGAIRQGTAVLSEVVEVGERVPRISVEPKIKPGKVSRFKADRIK
jgi:hypothetical protein